MAAQTPFVLAFDVGGTRLKAAAVTKTGQLLKTVIAPTHGHRGPRALLAALVATSRLLTRSLGKPIAVGLGLPGAVDPDRGIVLLPGRLTGLEGFPLVPRLSRALDLPVTAENDGRLSVVAEHRFGLLRRRNWGVTLTLGTGVGSGVLLDGRVLRDPHFQFGTQLSHIVLDAGSGRLCLTGARGTAEMFCSATALAHAVQDALGRGIPSQLHARFNKDPRTVDFEAIAQAARAGDALCRDELAHWTRNLGWLLVSAVHAYSPEAIVLSGGAVHAADLFLPKLRRQIAQHIFRFPRGSKPTLEISRLGDHQGALGAAACAWDKVQS